MRGFTLAAAGYMAWAGTVLAQQVPTIETIAGNGEYGPSVESGPATDSSFGWISDVTVDSEGSIYIADYEFGIIRRVDAQTGTISTVAGGGPIGFPNDGVLALEARINQPIAIAVDSSGNLFYVDSDPSYTDGNWYAGRVCRVDAVTKRLSTYAGGGLATEFQPLPVPVNGQTHIFVPSPDGVQALGAFIPWTNDLVVDPAGNLVAATMWQVRRINAQSGELSTIAGQRVTRFIYDSGPYYPGDPLPGANEGVSWSGFYGGDDGPAVDAGCGYPFAISYDPSGNLYIADPDEASNGPNSHVRRVDAVTGIISAYVGTGEKGVAGDGGPALQATTGLWGGMACDSRGNLYLTERYSVRRVDAATRIITTIAGSADTGGFAGDGGPAGGALLNGPYAIAFDPEGNLLIADSDNYRVRKVTFHNDTPPTASAGPDQSIHAGQLLSLDGSASFDDNTATQDLSFEWTLVSTPAGSAAALDDPASATPSFTADKPGSYTLMLVVRDSLNQASPADEVVISSTNLAPTADAGGDQVVAVGTAAMLDGASSSDPEMDTLSYAWFVTESPAGSSPVLLGAFLPQCALVPDMPGSYIVSLFVDDGFGPSVADTVLVTCITGEQFVENTAAEVIADIQALPPNAVTSAGNAQSLVNLLTKAVQDAQNGKTNKALKDLQSALERTDGCILRGQPDTKGAGRDWITDCDAQVEAYQQLQDAIAAISP